VAQVACSAKVIYPAFQPAFKGDSGITERAEGCEYRQVAQDIVHNLVPDQDLERIGLSDAAHLHCHNRLAVIEPFGRGVGWDELRILNGRDAIFARTAGLELREGHTMDAEIRFPSPRGEA